MRCAWALAAACLCGCAGLAPVRDHGATGWLRLESKHFVLHTDLRESSARDTILTFERFLDAYLQLGWEAKGELPVKLHIVVFDDLSDFGAFAGDTGGFYVHVNVFEPLVVMPNAGRIDNWATLKHELTHYIATQSLPLQPPWFSEGIATYFQTAYFDSSQGFVIGEVPTLLHRVLRQKGIEPARELFAAEPGNLQARFYASSWLLVHYLMSERGEAFVKLQDGIANGIGVDAAWAEAFPDLPADKLDEVLMRYFERGEYAAYAQPVKPVAVAAPAISAMSSADVYALRARLFLGCPACTEDQLGAAIDNIEQALHRDPQQLEASVLRIIVLPDQRRLESARALVQAHPGAWQAWATLVMTEQSVEHAARCSPEARIHLAELSANSVYAMMLSAICEAAEGDKQKALSIAARALRRQPADARLLAMQAGLLLHLRECAALQQLVPRLKNVVHAKIDSKLFARIEACTPSAPPPAR
jgi:tetratricopeptide (TPR) repeat protein